MSSKRTTYTQARETLLERITEELKRDERFVAAWLAGSFGRGEQRWHSDLDLHVVVADAYSESLCAMPWPHGARTTDERLALFKQFGTPGIIFEAHGNNLLGGTFTHVVYQESAQNVDWMLIPQAKAYQEHPSLVLFDKVGIPEPPPAQPESQEELVVHASDNIGSFWMIADESVKDLLDGNLVNFHMLLLWIEENIREVRAALGGERAPYVGHSDLPVCATQQEQVAILRRLCDEMEELMPQVAAMGGYLPSSPRTLVEKRLALLE